jgi:hypothetical protein
MNRPLYSERIEITRYDDVLDFPAIYLSELPLATTLRTKVLGIRRDVLFTTSRIRLAGAIAANQIVFSPGEYIAAIIAAQKCRARSADMRTWCLRKAIDYRWFLTLREAVGQTLTVQQDQRGSSRETPQRPDWTWGRFLQHFEIELLKVEIEKGVINGKEKQIERISSRISNLQ